MHHNDVPDVDPRHDITDLFAFPAGRARDRSALILNVHPDLRPGTEPVDPTAAYEIKLDLDADLRPDLAFHVLFDRDDTRRLVATVLLARGPQARESGRVGDVLADGAVVSTYGGPEITEVDGYRFFAGPRSDPFFADRDGFVDGMRWTGRDYFADHDVFSIALEVPHSVLAGRHEMSVWARTVSMDGTRGTVRNQAGRPGNNVFRPDPEMFQTVEPAQQRAQFRSRYVEAFRDLGYPEAEAARLADEWVPDVLAYDCSSGANFPNGRHPTDDVVDAVIRVLTRAPIPPHARLAAHADLLDEFPYLGAPHQRDAAGAALT